MAKNLQQRGRQYYCQILIPRPLRHHFPNETTGRGQTTIWEALGPDLTVAKPKCAARIAHWESVFARLRAGESLDAINAADKAADEIGRLLAAEPFIYTGEAKIFPDHVARAFAEGLRALRLREAPTTAVPMPVEPAAPSETVSQAAEALYDALTRDKRRQTTVDGHRLRVRAFVEACGDIPLSAITRATASDFLDRIGERLSNRTRNSYAQTMALVIETARKRGRFQGENPFEGQKAKATGESYKPFEPVELRALFAALPREVKPAKHTPETALPWVALIAAYTGMRLEEIAQLSVADVREVQANGATITVIDIHNGGNNALKNKASARLVPVHSELVRAGLLRYVKALPRGGMLFPGLIRRASKGGKIGARLGELFRKRLVALGIKRDGLCFHSFRHTVAGKLEQASVSQTDAARVLGHAIAGMSYGVYSSGPGLKRLAGIVEEIRY